MTPKSIFWFKVSFFFNIYWFIYVAAAAAKSLQSCPTLCDPIDSSPPGSPVPRILQARTLEWLQWVLIAACGIWFLEQGSNLGPMHWEFGVLAIGPSGKSAKFWIKRCYWGSRKVGIGKVKESLYPPLKPLPSNPLSQCSEDWHKL